MHVRNGVQRMPTELLNRSFVYLDVETLVHMAHVCRRWRSISFDHPHYWGHVVLDSVSPSALDFASHRVSQVHGRPVCFEIQYKDVHEQVLKRMVPLLEQVVPCARVLRINIESMYRLHVEKALSQRAKKLESLQLLYHADLEPDLPLTMPFGKGNNIFEGMVDRLRFIRLNNVILPEIPIPALSNVDEVHWNHAVTTYQEEFPCYLFEFFPKATRLSMTGGSCWFQNAPLPEEIRQAFARLTFFDMEFLPATVSAFFNHLPMHSIPELLISCPDEDGIYSALDPLRSPFHMSIRRCISTEFHISVTGSQPDKLVRHFAEAFHYYYPDSDKTNLLLENDEFAAQLASFRIFTSLWTLLNPLLPSLASLPKLIVELDDETPDVVSLPKEPLPCPGLMTLVLQASEDFAYVDPADVIAFADRITKQRVSLELRRVLLSGPRDMLESWFDSVTYSEEWYGVDGCTHV